MTGRIEASSTSAEAAAATARGGAVVDRPATPGQPVMRWSSRARSIPDIQAELARIWSIPKLTATVDGVEERHVAARTSVMNLVVIARRPELGERCASIVSQLTGRHPSRTLVVSSADPDGPNWLDAQVQANCMLPREDAPEVCAELIYLTAGGESGRHLAGIVAPLIVHDLPLVLWWPGEPPFGAAPAHDLLGLTDRLIVDGSTWSGDGLARLGQMAALLDRFELAISDFALVRQSRWREAIASVFDMPECLPYLRSLRRISVTYAAHDGSAEPGSTNVVKPVYHVAWLGSRLGMTVDRALHPAAPPHPVGRGSARPGSTTIGRGLTAALRSATGEVSVVVRPILSAMPSGTTLRVELLAARRGSEFRADVTAEAEVVNVRAWQDGVELLARSFLAPRRMEVDLLAEAIEAGGRDPVTTGVIRFAAELIGSPGSADEKRSA
ncbi:MAG TPA: glucose-6-phosphate dehydrogenase assembly protein OpcA [Candidatus Limnocylindrales bacterium]